MRKVLPLLLGAALVAAVPSVAYATGGPAAPSGVSGTVQATGSSTDSIVAGNHGPTDVVVRRIVIEPGGSTGWHQHPGQLIAVVVAGTLSRQLEDCSVQVSSAGQAFVEPAGPEHRHNGSNLGDQPVELQVSYLIPAGAPLSVPETDPGC